MHCRTITCQVTIQHYRKFEFPNNIPETEHAELIRDALLDGLGNPDQEVMQIMIDNIRVAEGEN